MHVPVRASWPSRGGFKIWKAIILMVEVLHEAIDMRRAAYRTRPMLDE
jgi:hypothetical protein